MVKKLTIGLAVLALLVAILQIGLEVGRLRSLTDEQKIMRTIEETKKAAESRDLNAILAFISPRFEAAGMTRQQVRVMLMQGLRDARNVRVTYSPPKISIKGDVATATFETINVKYDVAGAPGDNSAMDVSVELVREPVRRYLVFGDSEWRFAEANRLPGNPSP